jgi:hypothetical protein
MWLALALLAASAAGLAINLYFVTLFYPVPPRLARLLGGAVKACGIDGGACARAVKTPYARLLAGRPNVVWGVPWSLLCIVLAAVHLATGRFLLWGPAMAVAAASVLLGLYLTWALLFDLKDP